MLMVCWYPSTVANALTKAGLHYEDLIVRNMKIEWPSLIGHYSTW